jgi:hypothetical protein
MQKLLLTFTLLIVVTISNAQFVFNDWDANPALHKIETDYQKESAIIVKDNRVHAFAIDAKGGLALKVYGHKIVRVTDDKGVEMYNKVYIPVSREGKFNQIKARTISANNKVTNLPANKILDAEEEGRTYKKFALEGVEKGSEIEYYYEMEKPASFFGVDFFNTASVPCQEANFQLVTPDFLYFTVKGYNGFTTLEDTTMNKVRSVHIQAKNFQGLEEEKYASVDANIKNVQYKFSYNLSKDKNARMFSWNEFAKNVYESYNTPTKGEEKAVKSFLKDVNLSDNADEETKVILLEDYIKTNINVDEKSDNEDINKIEKIVKSKVATKSSISKLFIYCLNQLGIKYQIVYPSKRDELPLDKQLENYRLVDELLVYFPNLKKFVDPTETSFRYPIVEPHRAATSGLYIKSTTIGSLNTAIAAFDQIEILPTEYSHHNMDIAVKLNSALDSIEVHCTQSYLGYGAAYYRPAYSFLAKDKIEDFNKELINGVIRTGTIKNVKTSNTAMTDGAKSLPYLLEYDITNGEYVEKAGKKILVKVGELIGPQVQMYQEKKRQLPIIIQYPHNLDRIIKFTIPDGYQVKNAAELNFNVTDKKDNTETMGFVSSYKQEGNVLSVNIHEFYKSTYYDVAIYPAFEKVINASADFNKVVLVLEKK